MVDEKLKVMLEDVCDEVILCWPEDFNSQAIKNYGYIYAHCELTLNGKLFMAVSEAPKECDTRPKTAWQTMAFNVYDMGSEEAVRQAYDILKDGGTIIDPLGP